MANYGLLFVANASKAHKYLVRASQFVQKGLYISFNGSSENSLPVLNKQIVKIYTEATHHCNNLDIRFILKPTDILRNFLINHPIDVIIYEHSLENEVISNVKEKTPHSDHSCRLEDLGIQEEPLASDSNLEPVKAYEYVALGGTFDRLHNGHKILLSQATLRATKHVTVGVTDVNMIRSKKLWELIEPMEVRINSVLDFLSNINPDLEYNVVPIHDVYGPTIDDPKYQLIVVSEETSRAVPKINEKRTERGMEPLDSYVIQLAADFSRRSQEEEEKVSSSNQRMRLLGTLLKPPVPNPNIPDWPYVIGLAGGIASGKSSIAEKLKAKGAAVVNCDLIAHEVYKPGLPLNGTLAETFGREILTETGEIDRRKLGQIVFSDKNKLDKLNEIVWPAIIEEAEKRIRLLGEQGFRVVVMEAAVMVRAGWYKRTHQLWSVIIPPNEAIKRLQERNGLSEEEARQRLEAQPSNLEQVAHANMVFSPYWSYEYTQSQVDKAWVQLNEYLNTRQ